MQILQISWLFNMLVGCYYAPAPGGKGAISVAFVRLSRIQQIIPEPQGLVCPNFEGRFHTIDVTHIPISRSIGQR